MDFWTINAICVIITIDIFVNIQMVQIQILGSGSSLGVPVLGCECKVCASNDAKNKRLRSSILISFQAEGEIRNILVDCGFDIKRQLMRAGVKKLDAVILTHYHADHVSGLDELRVFSSLNGKKLMPIYLTSDSWGHLSVAYDYMFKNQHLQQHVIDYYDKIELFGLTISFFRQDHTVMDSLGFRVNNFVYANDLAFFYEKSFEYLRDMDVFVVDCCNYQSNMVHAGLERVMQWRDQFTPKKIYLTNLSHKIDYFEIQKILPSDMHPAHDGLTLSI